MAEDHTPTDLYDRYCKQASGPLATVRWCTLCDHFEKLPTGRGGVGRGYGMREGNKARGRMIQHMREAHSDLLTLSGTLPDSP